ncbi:MAG: tetratricopeptide repeat protein [bacterium]
MAESSSLRSSPWIWPLAACFLLTALFACRKDFDFDLGFHLRAGQWIVQNHAVPRVDSFTYTVTTHPYIDMLWLYETACYGLQQWGGLVLVSVVHDLLILTAFMLLAVRLLKTGAPPGLTVLLFFPAILCCELRFLLRPEILSWIFLLLTLLVLDERKKLGRLPWIFLPLLQIIWVNTEGLFVLEWVVLGAYLVSDWIESGRPDRGLVRAFYLTVAAAFVNPYFLQGVLFPFTLLTHLEPYNVFHHFVAEFQSPWSVPRRQNVPFFPSLPLALYKIMSLGLLALIAMSFRKRKIHEWFLASAFFGLSVFSIRNIPLFFFVALPIGASCLKEFLRASLPWVQTLSAHLRSRPWAARVTTLFILLLALRVATQAYYVSDRRMVHNGFGMDEGQIPVKAVKFLDRYQLNGTLLNNQAFGSWLDWKGPGPVFIDGRLEVMGASFYTEYLHSYEPGGLKPLLQKYGIQLVLLDHMMDMPWVAQLQTLPDWRLIYFDDLSAIYARKGYAPQFAALNFRAALPAWGMATEPPDTILTNLRNVNRFPLADWMNGFGLIQNYPMPLMRVGTFAYENGQFEVARDFFLKALAQSQGKYYEIYYNLGAAYTRLGRSDLARLCYQKTLELDPSLAMAREKLDDD